MTAETSKKKVLRVSLAQTVDSVIVHDMKNLAFRLSALLQNLHYPLLRSPATPGWREYAG